MKQSDKATIFDPLRKIEVACTPEEFVRQKVILWLNREKGISLNLMMSEYQFKYNNLNYRADIVVFDKELKPYILVECKAPDVNLDRKIIEQGVRYNRVLNVKYMIFTNGSSMFFCERKKDSNEYVFKSEIIFSDN